MVHVRVLDVHVFHVIFFGNKAFFLTVFKGVLWGIGVAVGVSVLMIASWSFFQEDEKEGGWETTVFFPKWLFFLEGKLYLQRF